MLEKAWAAKRAADFRIRYDFHRRWGNFLKCSGCGARISRVVCDCGSSAYASTGYSWKGIKL
jgi:hypothetical protein